MAELVRKREALPFRRVLRLIPMTGRLSPSRNRNPDSFQPAETRTTSMDSSSAIVSTGTGADLNPCRFRRSSARRSISSRLSGATRCLSCPSKCRSHEIPRRTVCPVRSGTRLGESARWSSDPRQAEAPRPRHPKIQRSAQENEPTSFDDPPRYLRLTNVSVRRRQLSPLASRSDTSCCPDLGTDLDVQLVDRIISPFHYASPGQTRSKTPLKSSRRTFVLQTRHADLLSLIDTSFAS